MVGYKEKLTVIYLNCVSKDTKRLKGRCDCSLTVTGLEVGGLAASYPGYAL